MPGVRNEYRGRTLMVTVHVCQVPEASIADSSPDGYSACMPGARGEYRGRPLTVTVRVCQVPEESIADDP